jgi:hypothetical protein
MSPQSAGLKLDVRATSVSNVRELNEERTDMVSKQCNFQGLKGIKQLARVGPYLVIANRKLYEIGESRRYVLIHTTQSLVNSIHSSQDAAVMFAQKQN